MKNRITYVIFGLFVVLTSCSTVYYVPNGQNVPMIKEKGEFDFSGESGLTTRSQGENSSNQLGVQFAYGISNSLAVQLNMMAISSMFYFSNNGYNGGMIDGGIGYFKDFGNGLLFDTYALGGYGTITNLYPDENADGTLTLGYGRYCLQPSLSYVFSKHFSVSGSTRIGALVYNKVEMDFTNAYSYSTEQYFRRHNNAFYILEPALTLRVGGEHFKFQMQYIYSVNLTDRNFPRENKLLTIGLNIHY